MHFMQEAVLVLCTLLKICLSYYYRGVGLLWGLRLPLGDEKNVLIFNVKNTLKLEHF